MFRNLSLPQGNDSLLNYKKIYKHSSGITYIVGNKNNKHIIKKFDEIINTKYKSSYNNKLLNVYNKYFRKEIIVRQLLTLSSVVLLIAIILDKVIDPCVKKRMIRKKIRTNKKKNNFILYYQPIVNPNNNEVVGFESLLRLKDKNNKILLPSSFIKDIELSNMFVEMNTWILERVIYDYKVISNYECYKNKDFYISINLSFEELENEYFVNKIIDIANKNKIKPGSICLEIVECYKNKDFYISINLSFEELENEYFVNKIIDIANKNKIKPGSICLEIVEKIGIKDLKNIKTTIDNLKNNGFKILL